MFITQILYLCTIRTLTISGTGTECSVFDERCKFFLAEEARLL